MSMSKRMSVGLVSIIFLVALVSAMPVNANKGFSVYRWWTENRYTGFPWGGSDDPEWTGKIWTGGPDGKYDGLCGTIIWDSLDFYIVGEVQKYSGIWRIVWEDGGIIEGTHDGSCPNAIMQFTINGRITKTTAGTDIDWSHLDGRQMHTIGIADFSVDPPYSECYIQID